MNHRPMSVGLLVVGGLLLLAGCQAPAASGVTDDPDSDRLGWENGVWYNDSLSIDNSDGLDAEERDALVARVMARLELVRGLEFQESVSIEIIGRNEATVPIFSSFQ